MGRTQIALQASIDHLSILDSDGNIDTELEPDIDDSLHLKLFKAMLLGRRFDERMLHLQRQGRIGTFPPIKGQEASQIGAVALLRQQDWFVPSFRETAAEIMRGRTMESVLLYYNGFNEGTVIAKEQKDLPMSVPVASQILHAVGLGWAAKFKKNDEVVMTFFGDGATSEGDFHEGLNCAAVYGIPVVFICQNNQWAISLPVEKQTHSETLAQKALAYGMEGIRVDGNDILAVYAAAKEAVLRARRGEGPTFIECLTYRVMMHTTADDPGRYREDDEVDKWKQRDPLVRYQNYLEEKIILNSGLLEDLEAGIQDEIQKAVDAAEAEMEKAGNPLDMFNHVYQELDDELIQQQAKLKARLKAPSVQGRKGNG